MKIIIITLLLLMSVNIVFSQTQRLKLNRPLADNNLLITNPSNVSIKLCPGCTQNWINGNSNSCLIWEVSSTNTVGQSFLATFVNPGNNALSLTWVWQYQDDNSGTWKSFTSDQNPNATTFTVYAAGSTTGTNVIRFRVCVTQAGVSCSQEAGQLLCGFNVTVQCQ